MTSYHNPTGPLLGLLIGLMSLPITLFFIVKGFRKFLPLISMSKTERLIRNQTKDCNLEVNFPEVLNAISALITEKSPHTQRSLNSQQDIIQLVQYARLAAISRLSSSKTLGRLTLINEDFLIALKKRYKKSFYSFLTPDKQTTLAAGPSQIGSLTETHAKFFTTIDTFLTNQKALSKNTLLLCGPTGTGKTTFGEMLAHRGNNVFIRSARELLYNSTKDEAIKKIETLIIQTNKLCIIFIDNFELITGTSDSEIASLSNLMSIIHRRPYIFFIAVTQKKEVLPNSIIDSLPTIIEICLPSEADIINLLKHYTTNRTVDFSRLAQHFYKQGFSIDNVIAQAQIFSSQLNLDPTLDPNGVINELMKDPFDKIIGHQAAKASLSKALSIVDAQRGLLKRFTLKPQLFFLFHGPAGTGKTSLAIAFAEKLNKKIPIKFTKIFATQLVSMWMGQTTQHIFNLINKLDPNERHIIFIDEIDILTATRLKVENSATREFNTTTTTFMTILDICSERNIFLVGATNCVSSMDRSVLRRFTIQIEVPCPSEQDIPQIVQHFTPNCILEDITSESVLSIIKEQNLRSPAEIENYLGQVKLEAFSDVSDSNLDLWTAPLPLRLKHFKASSSQVSHK